MTKFSRFLLVALLAMAGAFAGAGVAAADIENSDGTNVQDGENETTTTQNGTSNSGDAVGGQVTGVVSSGDSSVDASNRSEDVDIETGAANGENSSANFTGLNASTSTSIGGDAEAEDIEGSTGVNLQDGDNQLDLSQSVSASSGDGVAGQVIGAVTSAGGSADVVAANESLDSDVETGEANGENSAGAFVGLNSNAGEVDGTVVGSDIIDSDGVNVQEGDNELSGDQSADAASGDGVAGQVLGIVSAGDASVDASNRSEDVDLETGESNAFNDAARFVGLNNSTSTAVDAGEEDAELADIEGSSGTNLQEGDNEASLDQSATASSGDAVGGQVAGIVTSAGGSADAVFANESEDVDGESGETTHSNEDEGFTGLNFNTGTFFLGDGVDGDTVS